MKGTIKNRTSNTNFEGEYASLDYHIVASQEVIQFFYDVIQCLETKYPKEWENPELIKKE